MWALEEEGGGTVVAAREEEDDGAREGRRRRQATKEGGCTGRSEEIGGASLHTRQVRVGGGRQRRQPLVGSELEEDDSNPVGERRFGGLRRCRALAGQRRLVDLVGMV